MELIDIMPLEKWVEIEKIIHRKSGLNAAVYDARGKRITNYIKWANKLCPSLRATEKGLQSICSVAHQNVAARILKNHQTVIDDCDAGLMKFAVPIFLRKEFVGVAGGCGKLRGQGQVDGYLVHRTTDLDENLVNDLSGDVQTISESGLESVINYVENRVNEVIEEYCCMIVDGA